MRKITVGDRLRYTFDNTMSRGPIALIGWLAVISAIMIIIIALFVLLTGNAPVGEDGNPLPLGELIWYNLMRTLDAGTMGGDTGSGVFLFAMLAVTLGGIFVVSTLIGVLTSGIETKMDELRKGRSFVVEHNHTVILGWSAQVFSIISELVLANANQPRACIAILAEKDKVEMEDEIRGRVGNTGNTRIVCRTGSPIDLNDLEIVNPDGARSIIILASEAEDPDSLVIKTILALTNNPNRRPEPYHIVAEIRDTKNLEVARMVARDEAELLPVSTLISRIAVQTCRQSGLSVVYTELMDFGGDEIYFKQEPGLVGKTFADALLAYEESTIIGLRVKDGRVMVNPPMTQRIESGDMVIAISEDDDTIRLSGMTDYGIAASAIQDGYMPQHTPERTLILGWNDRGAIMINELDNYVAPGSEVMVVADNSEVEQEIARECAGVKNQRVTFQEGNTTDRRILDGLAIHTYNHIITLSYSDALPPQEADARTLITLLHLRDIAEKTQHRLAIVSEMLDSRNRELAEVTHADDFIVSDQLISLMLSQISENKELMAVFTDLFDPEGSELYLKPAIAYVRPGTPVNFYTVIEAARRRGEVAIGYRLTAHAGDASNSYGVHVNPAKSGKVTFGEQDRVIVLAED